MAVKNGFSCRRHNVLDIPRNIIITDLYNYINYLIILRLWDKIIKSTEVDCIFKQESDNKVLDMSHYLINHDITSKLLTQHNGKHYISLQCHTEQKTINFSEPNKTSVSMITGTSKHRWSKWISNYYWFTCYYANDNIIQAAIFMALLI